MQRVRAPKQERIASREFGEGPAAVLLRRLLAEARRSADGEAYHELAQGRAYRLSIAVTPRRPQFTLVVLIDSPDRVGPRGRISHGGLARVESALAARGYASARLDNGWMAHERSVAPSRLAAEWRFLRGLLGAREGRL